MRSRAVALLVAVVAFSSWPGVSGAEDDAGTTDTTVPPTTAAPPTTAPPPTTVPEEPPATTVPEPAPTTVPEVEPPSEGATGERTLRVRPRQDLVDGQEVVVRGQGWRPHSYVEAAVQCRAGIAGRSGCGGRAAEARTDARGNFRVEFEVQVILETPSGTYDCRVAPCVVRAVDRRLEGSRSVRLLFDPAGPDPVREEASISPDTDLIDGQVVTVVGEGFDVSDRYYGIGELISCRLPVTDRDDCDELTETYAEIGRDGYLATTYRLEALLHVDGEAVDCRTTECALFVGEQRYSLARAASFPPHFDPDAPLGPPPTVTITPSTDLRDGQIVDVDGEGLQADTFLFLAHCRWGATDFNACGVEDFNYAKVRADGTFHTQIGLRALFHTSRNDRVNCRVATCSLTAFGEGGYPYFFSPEGFGGGSATRVTRTRLRFLPDAPLLEPSISTPDLEGVRSGSRWRIWGTGGRPEGTVVLVQCLAGAQSLDGCAQGTRRHVHSHFEPRDRVGVSWETRYRFKRHLHLSSGRQVDCAAVSCALVAIDRGGGLEQSDRITTAFVG